jgi:oligoribonuclease
MAEISAQNLIWLDLEMTGLDPEHDRILEIATVVTDSNLNILAEGPVFAIYQADDLLASMDDWNTKHHNQSGLVERVQNSSITESTAEQQTIAFLQQYVPAGKSPLCGNSICQDRRFLANYMPALCNFFHYRHIDVSTLKELACRWSPTLKAGFTKHNKHLALDDIKESIEELKYYRENFIKG